MNAHSPRSVRAASFRTFVAIALLTAVYALNMGNRFLVSTLTEPIKTEFGLDDSQVGLLTGAISAVFFALSTVPLGVLADRKSRGGVIALSTLLFSAMTAIGSLAPGFLVLAMSRVGVGIGTGGTVPASTSLIADMVSPRNRSTVTTLFSLGISIGAVLGTAGVGWVAAEYGWRIAMAAFGLAGLPVALMTWWFVPEPRQDPGASATEASPSFRETLAFIWKTPTLRHLMAGTGVVTGWSWGLILWLPPYLERSHGLSAFDSGVLLAAIHLIGGVGVTLLTATIIRGLAERSIGAQLLFVAIGVGLATIPSLLVFLPLPLAIIKAMLWIYVPAAYLYTGPVYALASDLTPARMRSQVIAVVSLVSTLSNLMILPPLLGFTSDLIALRVHDHAVSLQYALASFSMLGFWGAAHFALAARYSSSEGAGALA